MLTHSGPDYPQDQLYVGDHDADQESDADHEPGDQVEPSITQS